MVSAAGRGECGAVKTTLPLALAAAAAAHAQAPATPPPPPTAPAQQIEITGGRDNDTDQRRQATASKIVIGREEIDKYGDSNLGEVLRRLPGVTTPGAPGRGGPPRMRGLGNGYTQILIDGQRMPPGFSLDSLTPEQIERIEILRAPTAETGARAIAGTINVITREGYRRRINELRPGVQVEDGELSYGLNATRNDSLDDFIYNLTIGAFTNRRRNESRTDTVDTALAGGAVTEQTTDRSEVHEIRKGTNLSGRLQWRLAGGDSFTVNPSLFHIEGRSARRFTLDQALPAPPALPLYDDGSTSGDSRFTTARVGATWRQRLGTDLRLEADGGVNGAEGASRSLRTERRDGQASPLRTLEDSARSRERGWTLRSKFTQLVGGDPERPGSEHSLVAGLEAEGVNRRETRSTLDDGAPVLAQYGDTLTASSRRLAAYAQDEWSLTPNWALHAGLRWEGIDTQGDAGDGTRPENRSSVATPLLHAVWKPDPKGRDQVRLSLTRSYRSPQLAQLVAKPSVASKYPVSGGNDPTGADRAGNPGLKPELATGVDLAVERYLSGGGLLSANLFSRRITDLIRNVVSLEDVPWSTSGRWVSRPQNIGRARTHGLELEAKFGLDQLVEGAPRVELRANAAFFRSRVDSVPGPDNRLDQQAKATLNLGADWRIRGTPLAVGGNVNAVPGYATQEDEKQRVTLGAKRVVDVYGLWTFNPATALRVLASNLAPRDYESGNTITTATYVEAATTRSPSAVNWQLRLELKL